MTLASETDSVETIRLIVDPDESTMNQASDWPNLGAVPDRVELNRNVKPSEKTINNRRSDLSIYVWSPQTGVIEQFAAGVNTYEDVEIVVCELWGNGGEPASAASDIRAHLVANYWPDGQRNTQWREIRPTNPNDMRAQAFHVSNFERVNELIRLEGLRST